MTKLEESWSDVLTAKNVRAFVQHLDDLHRTCTYIAGQVEGKKVNPFSPSASLFP